MTSPGNQPPKQDLPDQVSDVLIKLLITGGGGSTLFFLFREQIPSALIAMFVTGGATLLTSFGKGLMAPLKAWFNELGAKAGNAVTTRADSTLENLSGIDTKYLKALQTHCYGLEVEGFKSDLPSLELKEIFVPLRLDSDPSNQSNHNSVKNIWELLPKQHQFTNKYYRRLAIIADPGYGKTTLTRYLTLNYAEQANRAYGNDDLLPILLPFRDMHGLIQDKRTPNLPNLILSQVKQLPLCQDLDVSANWFKQRLDQGQCLIMFDGLDEVPNTFREKVSEWTNWQMQAYPSQFIITSRPHGYDNSLFPGVMRVCILDFTIKDKEIFINKWYRAVLWRKKWETHFLRSLDRLPNEQLSREQVRAQCENEAAKAADELMKQIVKMPALNELAKNPLLATIIAATYEAFEYLPEKRVKLYKKIFDLLLEHRPYRRETRLAIASAEESQPILQQLAFKLTETGREKFTSQQGSEWIADRLEQVDIERPVKPKVFLKQIQTTAGLLAGGDSDLYEFTHKTFQEYLAALEIREQYTTEYLLQHLRDADWQEIISFYVAMTNATPFISEILANPNKGSLKFAHRIVIEERAKIDPNVKEKLETRLATFDLGTQANARVRLEQRFRKLVSLGTIAYSPDPITCAEYALFLADQKSSQFHSQAAEQALDFSQSEQPIRNVIVNDALWFCAWLNTQTNLQLPEKSYTYLPLVKTSSGQLETVYDATVVPDSTLLQLLVARIPVHKCYINLINYLANARWQEANKETEKVMIEVANRKEQGFLDINSIKVFPCKDLRLIDQLWFKFSGGRYGFSVQKEIYLSCGGITNYRYHENIEKKFGAVVGWRENGSWTFNMKWDGFGPDGHLPVALRMNNVEAAGNKGSVITVWCVVRIEECILEQSLQQALCETKALNSP